MRFPEKVLLTKWTPKTLHRLEVRCLSALSSKHTERQVLRSVASLALYPFKPVTRTTESRISFKDSGLGLAARKTWPLHAGDCEGSRSALWDMLSGTYPFSNAHVKVGQIILVDCQKPGIVPHYSFKLLLSLFHSSQGSIEMVVSKVGAGSTIKACRSDHDAIDIVIYNNGQMWSLLQSQKPLTT